MKDEEKNLIENLFHRLKNTELNSSERDSAAENLIQELVKKQPASSYYMAQTILIQETAIKKMSATIEELKRKILSFNKEEKNKKPSFLSNFFKKNQVESTMPYNDNAWKNKENNILPSYNTNAHGVSAAPTTTLPINSIRNNNGFLANALQTATGVAGGMILGNMLMNVFNHSKSSEEETLDTINHSSHYENNHHDNYNTEENIINHSDQNHLVDYQYSSSEDIHHSNILNKEYINEESTTNNDINDDTYDTVDINDDNFI